MMVSKTQPVYELRARRRGPGDTEVEVWQLPSLATPQIATPIRLAGLRGRNLELAEHRVLKRLKESGIRLDLLPIEGMGSALAEETALRLALLFRTLAPMRNRDNMRLVAEGIEAMGKEEAGYWLGMSVHRKNPRRVLSPDLNPIEQAFAKLKALLRKAAARTFEALIKAIAQALAEFTPQECANYIANSGYRHAS